MERQLHERSRSLGFERPATLRGPKSESAKKEGKGDFKRKLNSILILFIVSNSFLLLVVRPGAPNSVLAPSSHARSP